MAPRWITQLPGPFAAVSSGQSGRKARAASAKTGGAIGRLIGWLLIAPFYLVYALFVWPFVHVARKRAPKRRMTHRTRAR
jgi:hypothetical protein